MRNLIKKILKEDQSIWNGEVNIGDVFKINVEHPVLVRIREIDCNGDPGHKRVITSDWGVVITI